MLSVLLLASIVAYQQVFSCRVVTVESKRQSLKYNYAKYRLKSVRDVRSDARVALFQGNNDQ